MNVYIMHENNFVISLKLESNGCTDSASYTLRQCTSTIAHTL